MKEEIDWKKEILESRRFNNKFEKNLLENGAKNFMQGIYLGYMYSRWRKLKGLNLNDSKENSGQMQSNFKEFEAKIKKDWLKSRLIWGLFLQKFMNWKKKFLNLIIFWCFGYEIYETTRGINRGRNYLIWFICLFR